MKFKGYLIIALLVIVFALPSWATVTYTTSGTVGPYSIGGKSRMVTGKLDLSGTYVTNGFSLTASSLGLSHIEMAILQPTDGYGAAWNASTGLVKMTTAASTEVSNGTSSVASVDVNFVVIGW